LTFFCSDTCGIVVRLLQLLYGSDVNEMLWSKTRLRLLILSSRKDQDLPKFCRDLRPRQD